MKDYFPFKVYTSTGLIVSECSTMEQAIQVAKKLKCKWEKLPNQQVGHIKKEEP